MSLTKEQTNLLIRRYKARDKIHGILWPMVKHERSRITGADILPTLCAWARKSDLVRNEAFRDSRGLIAEIVGYPKGFCDQRYLRAIETEREDGLYRLYIWHTDHEHSLDPVPTGSTGMVTSTHDSKYCPLATYMSIIDHLANLLAKGSSAHPE